MKWRYLLWLALPGIIAFGLMLTNSDVTNQYHVQRVQPFVLMSMAKAILIAILVMQHPGPPARVPGWKVHRWMDPLTIGLIAMLVASTAYYVMLWGGNSQQFRAPDWGYDLARQLLWLDGWMLSSLGMEVLYRGIRARRRDRLRRRAEYDLRDANGGDAGQ